MDQKRGDPGQGRSSIKWCEVAVAVALAWLLVGAAPVAFADTIRLKNGKQLNGVIEEQASDAQRMALRSAGALIYVQRDMIEKVEKRPRAEVEGDAALIRNDLDAALDFFQKALNELPEDAQLRRKYDDVKSQLVERDRKRYGARFDAIDKALAAGEYSRALQQAKDLDKQVQEAATHKRLQVIMSRACLGLAQEMRSRFRMAEAEEHYKQAIRFAPHYAPAALELARLYDQQAQKRAAAILLYQQAVDMARTQNDQLPANTYHDTRYRLAQLLFDAGRFDDSLKQMMDLIRQNQIAAYPQSIDYAIQILARFYAESPARANELKGCLTEIIQRKPTEDRALALLGRIEFDQKNIDAARPIFERVLTLTGNNISLPSRQDAGYYLGMIHRQRGELDKAVSLLQPIANAQTGNYSALCELGEVYLDQALNEQALERFKTARLLHADRFRASLGMGMALVYLKRNQEGREYLNEVLARDPKNIKALTALAQSYFDEKKYAEVREQAGTVVAIIETEAGDTPTADQAAKLVYLRTMLGTACLRLNQFFMAHAHFDKALKLKPDHALALNGIGETYQVEVRYDKAEEFFLKAMKADPKNPQYPLNLALNWQKYRQNPKNAIPYYKKYYELGGHDPSVRQWYIEAGGEPE